MKSLGSVSSLNNQHFQFSVSKDKKYHIPHPVFCQI